MFPAAVFFDLHWSGSWPQFFDPLQDFPNYYSFTNTEVIRYAQPRAMGSKVSDEWTVPLCATHHRSLHTVGDEEMWWKERQVDPMIHAELLWRERLGETVQQPSRARELISPGLS